jgi:hypothetical protein
LGSFPSKRAILSSVCCAGFTAAPGVVAVVLLRLAPIAINTPKMPNIIRITIPAIFFLLVFFRPSLLSVPLAVGTAGAKEMGFPQLEQNFEFGSIFYRLLGRKITLCYYYSANDIGEEKRQRDICSYLYSWI